MTRSTQVLCVCVCVCVFEEGLLRQGPHRYCVCVCV